MSQRVIESAQIKNLKYFHINEIHLCVQKREETRKKLYKIDY